jgi:hypothetical protein
MSATEDGFATTERIVHVKIIAPAQWRDEDVKEALHILWERFGPCAALYMDKEDGTQS